MTSNMSREQAPQWKPPKWWTDPGVLAVREAYMARVANENFPRRIVELVQPDTDDLEIVRGGVDYLHPMNQVNLESRPNLLRRFGGWVLRTVKKEA